MGFLVLGRLYNKPSIINIHGIATQAKIQVFKDYIIQT